MQTIWLCRKLRCRVVNWEVVGGQKGGAEVVSGLSTAANGGFVG
jgi:hypothetical protein